MRPGLPELFKSAMIVGKARIPKGLRVYAIGDIHGCFNELKTLLGLILKDMKNSPVKHSKFVFLGDYVDRGPECRKVMNMLVWLDGSKLNTVFLRGNHDDKLAVFLEHPEKIGDSFLQWGGHQTIEGYGVPVIAEQSFEKLSQAFRSAVPKSHVEFLSRLRHKHEEGDYFFAHAGVRPGVGLNSQTSHDLMWIRDDFLPNRKPYEKVIVHGHTITKKPEVRKNRINVDTGCYDTGTLTAVVLEGDEHRFLQT